MIRNLKFLFNALFRPAFMEAEHNRLLDKVKSINLAHNATSISEEEVAQLEEQIVKDPNDLNSRIKLLGKYSDGQYGGGPHKQLRLKHIEWVISHCPEHEIAGTESVEVDARIDEADYLKIKSVWLQQIEKDKTNLKVMANAANFFFLNDKDIAERVYLEALKMVPKDRDLRGRLAHLYSLWDGHEEQALLHTEIVCKGRNSYESLWEMSNLPARAFAAGKFERAQKSANKLLQIIKKYDKDKKHGDAVNSAHTILGRLALMRSDVAKAKYHLAQSVINISSPTMKSFGPTLVLARELLRAGEAESVLDYLDKRELLCGFGQREAFSLRYEIATGKQIATGCLYSDSDFELAFSKHKQSALRAMPPDLRTKHLKKEIKATEHELNRWSERVGSGLLNNEEESDLRELTEKIERINEHLCQLKALLATDT